MAATAIPRELDAPTRAESHAVQFYDDEAFLAAVVADFLAVGLVSGESAIVIATGPHRAELVTRLAGRGFDVPRLLDSRRLRMLDARDTLDAFLVDGTPDAAKFDAIVGAVCREPAGRLRAYGEMVDLLVRDGRADAAVQLEELWNGLASRRPMSLLCAYGMESFECAEQSGAFHRVCATHSHVQPAEGYAALSDADARLREVAQLQQRARALETELVVRGRVQQALTEAVTLRDEFLSVASHELRTPLTALRLQLATVTRSPEGEPVRERLHRASRQAERLSQLIEQLLDVSTISASELELKREEVDLAAVVRSAVELMADAPALAGCAIELRAEAKAIGWWDARRIGQLVEILLANALKYGAGSPIELAVESDPRCARLRVRDHGVGISQRDHHRIFERFERASPVRNYGGLGLGLWTARRIVHAHGGSIHVESALGDGATFIVELPLR